MPALYYRRKGDRVICILCPHRCSLAEGATGVCGVRANQGGSLILPYYGALSAQAIDPVEKKPLYHFYPGSRVFSIGFLGCPLRCPFCQNYRISQSTTAATESVTPAAVVESARATGSIGIAYTYNEPVVHFEYVMQTARLARAAGLRNILVTSGQINAEPAAELFDAMDAANIDLKSFAAEFYRRELHGDLSSVKQAIVIAAGACHVEVTTLVIPHKTDSESEIDAVAAFLAGIDRSIPYHLSAYYPAYRYVTEATTPQTVQRLAQVARRQLHFVYSGNIGGSNNTVCPHCGTCWIERTHYRSRVTGIVAGCCSGCGVQASVVGV